MSDIHVNYAKRKYCLCGFLIGINVRVKRACFFI